MFRGSFIHVRRAQPEDLPNIKTLWQEMMQYHQGRDVRFSTVPHAEDLAGDLMRNALRDPERLVLVAVDERRVVGYAYASILETVEMFQLSRYGFVADLAVTADARRKGVGTALWETLREWFIEQGVSAVQLNVSVLNPEAEAFWRDCGFADFLKVLWHDLEE